jgi:hypothetical protein
MIFDRNGYQILEGCVLFNIQTRELVVVTEVDDGEGDYVEIRLLVLESPRRDRVGWSMCMSYFTDHVVHRVAYEVLYVA